MTSSSRKEIKIKTIALHKLTSEDHKASESTKSPAFNGSDEGQISEYEYKRYLKVRRNEKHLESLGLLSHTDKHTANKRNKNTRKEKYNIAPTRSSARLKNTQPKYSSTDLEKLELENHPPPKRIRRSKYITKNYPLLTEEERKTLENISSEEFLDDLKFYMEKILQNSSQNIKNVAKTLKLLTNGEGVQHRRSQKKDNVFKKDVKITLVDNIPKLLDEARQWIDEHGGDVSNGWLLEHPLNKMINYQIARFKRGRPFHESKQEE